MYQVMILDPRVSKINVHRENHVPSVTWEVVSYLLIGHYYPKLSTGNFRSSCCDSAVTNLTSIHEDVGSIPGSAQQVKDPVLP